MTDEIRCELELRGYSEHDRVGRLIGTLLTYDQRASDRPEMFRPGALSWDTSGIVLNANHDSKNPIMRVIPEERDGKVIIDAMLPPTAAARDLATLIKNGTMRGLSVEFTPEAETVRNGIREISRAQLRGAAVVTDAAYGNSVVSVRNRQNGRRRLWL